MPELLAAHVGDNTIYIEAESIYGPEQTTSLDGTLERAGDALERAKATIESVATCMAGAITNLKGVSKPEEFTLEFAIKFNAEGSAIIAKASAEANLRISMTYKRMKDG